MTNAQTLKQERLDLKKGRRVLAVLAILALACDILFAPTNYYSFAIAGFFASLLLITAILEMRAIGPLLSGIAERFSSFLHKRGSFYSSAEAEIPKFAIIRIIFGAFLVHRAFYLFNYSFPDDWSNFSIAIMLATSLVSAICILLGFVTQIAFIFLVIVQWKIGDYALATATLGNAIAAMLAVVLFVANAGAHYSLDAIIRKRNIKDLSFALSLYDRRFIPTDGELQLIKFATLFAYSCVCLYSLSMHLNEPAWMTGVAGPQLLASNFMSKYYYLFESTFEASPLAVHVARISMWMMMIWYCSIIPFVLIGGIARAYVIWWGVLFFILSTFALQLGWLGQFEFLFWASLFWNKKFIADAPSITIVYDDRCNLCDRTVNALMRADLFKQIAFMPISTSKEFLRKNFIPDEAALTDLYAVDHLNSNNHLSGYNLYTTLTTRILLLAPLYPLFLMGRITRIGPPIYSWIAQRRIKLFGVCTLASPKPRAAIPSRRRFVLHKVRRLSPALVLSLHIFSLGAVYLALMPAPYVNWFGTPIPAALKPLSDNLTKQASFYGIIPIDVFNSVDLGMSVNWFTISAVYKDNREELIPVFNDDGSRLDWHKSDRIYYGYTVQWRRGAILSDKSCLFNESKTMLNYFIDLFEDKNDNSAIKYVFRQFKQPLADSEQLWNGNFQNTEPIVTCEKIIENDTGA
ncbi:thiol-disulfide oxidoreductase DCC family protein [Bosea sp. 2KB_26]|uniref:thiol-disulfide oxidoreductase DCC family protein n=1 Tax=Bosea sp. 2KB_26 TaxID=3237475 RepID=UPI003F91E785